MVRLLATLLVCYLSCTSAHATVFDLLGGGKAIKDAGAELENAVKKAHAAGEALIANGNQAAKDRLNQVDEIVNSALKQLENLGADAEQAALKILDDANQKLSAQIEQIFGELNATIWNVECSGKRMIIQDIGAMLGDVGKLIGANQIAVTPPIKPKYQWYKICPWCSGSGEAKFVIHDKFGDTYIEMRDFLLANLSTADGSDASYSIVDAYDYISTLAKRTSCFYDGGSQFYTEEYVKYREKAASWRRVLKMEVAK